MPTENEHLDTVEGRYWLRLEWRALARALRESGDARVLAVREALAFRQARHARFPANGSSRRLSAPVRSDEATVSGEGWTFKAAPGWVIREGARKGDYEVARRQP